MDRKEKILFLCDLNGNGLEIGPSFNPVVTKKEGYNVEIIDHLDREGLIKKYYGSGLNLDNIEKVDYVWKGEKYAELTGKKDYYDYIIASHVIEHTCDMITFLNDCSELLKKNGVLSLAIPDKRFVFDCFRPITNISKVIDSYFAKHTLHTPGSVCDFYLNTYSNDNRIVWDASIPLSNLCLSHKVDRIKEGLKDSLDRKGYIDIHNWVFTKSSFELLIHDLNFLGFIQLSIAKSFHTVGGEFYVSLKKTGESVIFDEDMRIQLLLDINRELREINFKSKILHLLNKLESGISESMQYFIDSIKRMSGYAVIDGWAFIEGMNCDSIVLYIEVLDKRGMPAVFSTMKKQRADVEENFDNKMYRNSGFAAVIDLSEFEFDFENNDKMSIKVIGVTI